MHRLFLSILFLSGVIFCQIAGGQNRYEKPNLRIEGNISEANIAGLLRDHYPALQQDGIGLQQTYFIESPGGWHITFEQTFQGKPILNSGVKINFFRTGKVSSVMNSLYDGPLNPVGSFALDAQQTITETALAHSAWQWNGYQVWYPQDGLLVPALAVELHLHHHPQAMTIFIDGRNGEELDRRTDAAFAPHSVGDTTGRALLFVPNPTTRSGLMYGNMLGGFPLVDNNDQHHPGFNMATDTVVLSGLLYEIDSFYLEGPHVRIEDISPFSYPQTVSANGDFFFTRDQHGFEEVMAYYHIDRYQRHVQNLGFLNLANGPLRVDPHGLQDADQSVFVPDSANGDYIKFGEGGVDDAEDADVIVHEYGHALSNSASPKTRVGKERSGLDEGIGDYIAAAYSQDITPSNWDRIFDWDGHNEFWSGRSATNPESFPPTNTSIYGYGELWASTMMQIRAALGPEVTDKLMLQELYANYINMTFADAARLTIDADSALFDGIHTETLLFYFCARNILSGATCLAVGLEPDQGKHLAWEVFSGLDGKSFFLEIEVPLPPKASLRIVNSLGQVCWKGDLDASSQAFSPELPPGIYLVELLAGKQSWGRKKIVLH